MKVIMKSRMRESRTYGSAKEFTSRGVDLLNLMLVLFGKSVYNKNNCSAVRQIHSCE